jgi:hypothetical protein
MRFTIEQKGEAETFEQLRNMMGAELERKWGNLSKRGDIAIFQVDSIVQLKPLISYLGRYPLKSYKSVAYHKWLKMVRVVEDGGRGKRFEELQAMAQDINRYVKDEDKVQP